MSDLNDFLRAAREESEEQRFERDYEAGRSGALRRLRSKRHTTGSRGGLFRLMNGVCEVHASGFSLDGDVLTFMG
jgi:hypothetical protein